MNLSPFKFLRPDMLLTLPVTQILKLHQYCYVRLPTRSSLWPPHPQKSSILTRAGEQRKRSQSMKSYPSSELRNMCDEHIASEEPAEKEDLLQQMLERR